MKTSSPHRSKHWQPEFEAILEAARSGSAHGNLVDIRESLRYTVGPNRPLVILCPHADDGAITGACLLHEYAVRRGLPVIEVLVYAGERNVAAPWLNDQKKISVREAEFQLECKVLGAESVCWDLEGYRMPGYAPTPDDIDKVVEWFTKRRPGALIVPPNNDAHVAHRVTRSLAAIGLLGANLDDTLILSGWTPWGPLPQPNAYFSYDGEAERTKEWAIHCHASQVLLTDYTQYCSHLGRAYAALAREWAEGHSISGRAHRGEDRFVGVELYQIESFNPERCLESERDPIHLALGYLSGYLKRSGAEDSSDHGIPPHQTPSASTPSSPVSKAASVV